MLAAPCVTLSWNLFSYRSFAHNGDNPDFFNAVSNNTQLPVSIIQAERIERWPSGIFEALPYRLKSLSGRRVTRLPDITILSATESRAAAKPQMRRWYPTVCNRRPEGAPLLLSPSTKGNS